MGVTMVDIVISTYNQSDQIGATIASIGQSTYPDYTLWIFDQSIHDDTERVVRSFAAADARIQYRRMPERGIAATRNSGVALGGAPYILFTNSDCTVEPGWVGAMVEALRNEQVWLVFGRVLPGPRPPGLAGAVTVLAIKDWPCLEMRRDDRFDLRFGHGHNMGARRDAFIELGGFDELHGAGAPFASWDDLDIGYRALRRGGAVAYTPAGVAYHCHWVRWADVWRQYRAYGLGAGAAVAKYLRCGDPQAWQLFARWVGYHGLRQVPAGVWRHNLGRARAGLSQLVAPWRGLARGMAVPVDRQHIIYQSSLIR